MWKISRLADMGVPARRLAVALSATSLPAGQAGPRADYRAVGFPLQSLTRKMVYLFITVVLSGCAESSSDHDFDTRKFSLPTIVQVLDTSVMELTSVDYMEMAHPVFSGKFRFGDTVDLDSSTTSRHEGDFVEEPRMTFGGDTMGTDGLQVITDYRKIIHPAVEYLRAESHYPVYVVNESSRAKFLYGKDRHVFAIQEALDASGWWRPIEGRAFDFCGNGRWALCVRPNEYVLFSMRRYTGNFKTKLRIRLVNGSATYVSEPFEGEINFKQFLVEPDGYFYEELSKDRALAISWIFYGSVPMSYDAPQR